MSENNNNNSGGQGGALALLALAVGAVVAFSGALLTAFAMGLGGVIVALLSVPLGRRFSRVRTGTRDDDKPIYAKIGVKDLIRFAWKQHFRRVPVGKLGIVTALGAILLTLTPWAGFLGQPAGSIVTAVAVIGGLVGGAAVNVAAVAVGRRFRKQLSQRLAERAKVSASLRWICGMSESAWADAHWELDQSSGSIVISGPPEAVAGAQKNADRIQDQMPGWTVDRTQDTRIAVLRPETAEETRRRQITGASGGLVLNVTTRADGLYDLELAPGISPTRAEHVEAWLQATNGTSLIVWEPIYNRAVAGLMSPEDRELRTRIAGLLGVHAHELTVMVTTDGEGVASLRIKAPAGRAADGESRVAQMRRVMMQAVPGAHADWLVTVDAVTDTTVMERRERQAIPQRVALAQVLPTRVTPAEWATIPVGVDSFGRAVGQVLTSAPMSLVVGPTGSGKTIYLLADAVGRLTRGHDLLIIDPSKGGVDFASLEPYSLGFARTFASSVAAIKAVYAEGQRRKEVLLREGAVKWADLSQEVRDAENIRPITVLIDEVASMLIQVQVPKGLPKDDPDFLEAQELAAQKALLAMFVGKIARELRFVGVFLLIAMQRPDATILGGEVRANFSHRVQLVPPGKPVGRTELEMLFPAPIVGAVWDAVNRFDDGNPGLAIMAGDEGDVAAARIGYTPMHEVPSLLAARLVHPVDAARKLNLAAAPAVGSSASTAPAAGTPASTAPAIEAHLRDLFA